MVNKDVFERRKNKHRIGLADKLEIKQNYISLRQNKELRLREKKWDGSVSKEVELTIKEYIKENVKQEYTIPLPSKYIITDFLMEYSGKPIIKIRHEIQLRTNSNYKKCFVDKFQQPNLSYYIAEVEFDNEEDMNNFIKPSWFDIELCISNLNIWKRLNSKVK